MNKYIELAINKFWADKEAESNNVYSADLTGVITELIRLQGQEAFYQVSVGENWRDYSKSDYDKYVAANDKRFRYRILYTSPPNLQSDLDKANAEIARLREALQNVLDGNYPSNRDTKCDHDKYSWEDCEQCIEAYIEQALAQGEQK